MNSLEQFLLRHRAQLQHFMDDDAHIIDNNVIIFDFVNKLLDDWDTLHGKKLPRFSREEMTFWFCLFQLESVAEIPPELPMLPYEESLFETLRDVRELLRHNCALPDLYYASRPYFSAGNSAEDDEEMYDAWLPYSGGNAQPR